MSADWPLKKISEVANFLNHKRVPLKSLDRNKRQGKFPYYGASGIVDHIDDYIFNGTYLLISEDGDNLRTRKTPIAFKASGKFWVNNHAHILEEKEEGILDYLEYYLSKLDLNSYITGAAQPKLNKANLDSIEIPIPPKNERLEINSILNSLTGKIRLNTQTNQTLESIAQAIFKSWFVDFEPVKAKMAAKERWYAMQSTSESASPVCYADEAALPDLETYTNLAAMCAISGKSETELTQLQQQNPDQYQQLAETAALFPSAMVDSEMGEIPEGWEPKSIYDICDVIYGAPFKSTLFNSKKKGLPLVRIRDLKDESPGVYTEEAHPKGYLIQNGDLIAGMDGEFRSYIWGGNAAWMNQRICCFKPKEFISTYLLKGFIDPHLNRYEKTATATTVIHLGKGDINNFSYLDAGRDILEVFNAATENLSSRLISNKLENLSLTQLRDSLLPKLLSGEIDLTKIENEVI